MVTLPGDRSDELLRESAIPYDRGDPAREVVERKSLDEAALRNPEQAIRKHRGGEPALSRQREVERKWDRHPDKSDVGVRRE